MCFNIIVENVMIFALRLLPIRLFVHYTAFISIVAHILSGRSNRDQHSPRYLFACWLSADARGEI